MVIAHLVIIAALTLMSQGKREFVIILDVSVLHVQSSRAGW